MTARECLRQARLRLQEAHVPDAEIDAAWLLGSVLGMGRLVELPQAECLYEDLETANIGGLLREMGNKIAPANGPYGEDAHSIGAVGHAEQIIILRGDHEW